MKISLEMSILSGIGLWLFFDDSFFFKEHICTHCLNLLFICESKLFLPFYSKNTFLSEDLEDFTSEIILDTFLSILLKSIFRFPF